MLIVAVLVLAVAVVGSAVFLRAPERLVRGVTRRRCLVSCKDARQFSGVLWAADRGCLVLKQAVMVGDDGTAPMDGEVLILRDDIAFIQFP